MTIPQALKKLTQDPTVKITRLARELDVDTSLLYRYIHKERNPGGLSKIGLAFYLYLKYNLETEELKPYKYLLEKQD
jgi:transposase-like protein